MDLKRLIKKIINGNKNDQKSTPYTKEILNGKRYIIGDFTYGLPNIYFEEKESNLIIGKFCSIAGNVTIFLGGNHRIDWITTYPFLDWVTNYDSPNVPYYNFSKGNVVIGNDVWLGYGVMILSGVTIGNGAVLAAGSIVSKDIGPYEIWGGNPARFIKKRFTDIQIEKLEQIKWWEWPIEKVKEHSSLLFSSNIEDFINKVTREINK